MKRSSRLKPEITAAALTTAIAVSIGCTIESYASSDETIRKSTDANSVDLDSTPNEVKGSVVDEFLNRLRQFELDVTKFENPQFAGKLERTEFDEWFNTLWTSSKSQLQISFRKLLYAHRQGPRAH